MTTGDAAPLRIGTTERTAAMKALDEHLAAGRLGVEEYADRSAAAANATVASELTALFTDLPAPHPELPGAAPAVPPTKAMPVVAAEPAQVAERAGGLLSEWGPRVVTFMPLIALLLFFATGRQWWWFLLIPIAGAIVYGGGVGRDRSDRDERRQERRDRR